LPLGAERPDREASETPLPVLQRAVSEQASDSIRECYDDALKSDPTLTGDLVVHIASRGGQNETVVGGPLTLRESVGGCVQRAIESVRFPIARDDVAWLHLPIRFARA
jgi:hypothetical protein